MKFYTTGVVVAASLFLFSCSGESEVKSEESNNEEVEYVEEVSPGVFKEVLPCADCEGIETIVHLKDDGTAVILETYLGEDEIPYASFGEWNSDKGNMTVAFPDREIRYKAQRDAIEMVTDFDVEEATTLDYTLEKSGEKVDFSKPFWADVHYFYMADAHIVKFGGKTYPVVADSTNMEMEQIFLSTPDSLREDFTSRLKLQLVEAEDMEGTNKEHAKIIEIVEIPRVAETTK